MQSPTGAILLERRHLQGLLDAILAQGFRVLGPFRRDGAIVYDDLRNVEELPIGWTDGQEAGTYRLHHRQDQALFGYVLGPQSWKKYLLPPQQTYLTAVREGGSIRFVEAEADGQPLALIGVRSCEIHAIEILDRVLMDIDAAYRARRERMLIVAVQCGLAGRTCFCASMATGPRATRGFDLALTELLEVGRHNFYVEIGSDRGRQLIDDLPHQPATARDQEAAAAATKRAETQMGRMLDTTDLRDLLYRQYEHPRWDHVAGRCLSCGNCTLVCPTCFCTTVEDTTALKSDRAARRRVWDSCFSLEFSYIHGGNIRPSPRARYRQWLTHKLATWQDQFGRVGCVGCGRCITWCPVGIDITEEVRAIRQSEQKHGDH